MLCDYYLWLLCSICVLLVIFMFDMSIVGWYLVSLSYCSSYFNWSLIVMIIVLLNSWAIAWFRLVLNLSFLFPSFGVINWLWIQFYARFSTLYLTFMIFWAKLSIYLVHALVFVVEWILLGEEFIRTCLGMHLEFTWFYWKYESDKGI